MTYYTLRPFTGYRLDAVPTKRDRRKKKNNIPHVGVYACARVCVKK